MEFFSIHRNFFQPLGCAASNDRLPRRTTHQLAIPRAGTLIAEIQLRYNRHRPYASPQRINGGDRAPRRCSSSKSSKRSSGWRRSALEDPTFANMHRRDGLVAGDRVHPRDTGESRDCLGDISDRRICPACRAMSGEPIASSDTLPEPSLQIACLAAPNGNRRRYPSRRFTPTDRSDTIDHIQIYPVTLPRPPYCGCDGNHSRSAWAHF